MNDTESTIEMLYSVGVKRVQLFLELTHPSHETYLSAQRHSRTAITRPIVDSVLEFLDSCVQRLRPNSVVIAFRDCGHMGQTPADFDHMLRRASEVVGGSVNLLFVLETTGEFINDEWINIFEFHRIGVEIQIDVRSLTPTNLLRDSNVSPRAVKEILCPLSSAFSEGRIRSLGAQIRADPVLNGKQIYQLVTQDLNLKRVDIFLPEGTHDSFDSALIPSYARFLNEFFDAWAADDDPRIHVRLFSALFSKLLHGQESHLFPHTNGSPQLLTISMHADGSFNLSGTRDQAFQLPSKQLFVDKCSFDELIRHPSFAEAERIRTSLPRACQNCVWRTTCGGGSASNRYSASHAYDNPSVLCIALKSFYTHVVSYLIAHDYQSSGSKDVIRSPRDPAPGI